MNPYITLGVSSNSSPNEIRRAYRQRARATHPDRPEGDHNAFLAVQAAYRALTEPELWSRSQGCPDLAMAIAEAEERQNARRQRRRRRLQRLYSSNHLG
ncbi:MAG: DnaJ domain-containing protein [Myxococcales bacterium]|nr:DnaJ domain-containing protein [Myxococcales bacterium]